MWIWDNIIELYTKRRPYLMIDINNISEPCTQCNLLYSTWSWWDNQFVFHMKNVPISFSQQIRRKVGLSCHHTLFASVWRWKGWNLFMPTHPSLSPPRGNPSIFFSLFPPKFSHLQHCFLASTILLLFLSEAVSGYTWIFSECPLIPFCSFSSHLYTLLYVMQPCFWVFWLSSLSVWLNAPLLRSVLSQSCCGFSHGFPLILLHNLNLPLVFVLVMPICFQLF